LKPKNKATSGLFGCSKLSENIEKILVLRQSWKYIICSIMFFFQSENSLYTVTTSFSQS